MTTVMIKTSTGRGRYLLGGAAAASDPVDLRAVAAELAAASDVDLVDVRGASDAPTLLVAEMSADIAEQLRLRHGGGLLVEPDAELDLS